MQPSTSQSGWTKGVLGQLIEKPQYGYTASALASQTDYKFLRITDIQNGTVDWATVPSCDCPKTVASRYLLKSGDIVVARIGATTGKAFLLEHCPPTLFASYLIRIRTKPFLRPDFLNLFFQTDDYKRQIDQKKGGRLKGGITVPTLQSLVLPLPSVSEQDAIVSLLRAIQQSKRAREIELTLERERKAALMQYLFTQGTRSEARNPTSLWEIPQSWTVSTIADVASVVSGGTPERSRLEYWNGNIPWVKTGEINYSAITETEETITDAGLKNSSTRVLPKGTLLMAMYGQGVTRGRVALLGIDAAINQACAALQMNGTCSADFLFHFLSFSYEKIRTIGHGANQKNLNAGLIRSIQIVVPPRNEQIKISQVLNACDAKIAALEKESKGLEELFTVILEQLMTGRLSAQSLIHNKF